MQGGQGGLRQSTCLKSIHRNRNARSPYHRRFWCSTRTDGSSSASVTDRNLRPHADAPDCERTKGITGSIFQVAMSRYRSSSAASPIISLLIPPINYAANYSPFSNERRLPRSISLRSLYESAPNRLRASRLLLGRHLAQTALANLPTVLVRRFNRSIHLLLAIQVSSTICRRPNWTASIRNTKWSWWSTWAATASEWPGTVSSKRFNRCKS